MNDKIPVTVLTGFLGAGKTTLLNRILSESHGLRIAVIENEFGEIGVDQDLVINADEEIFEMNNGCICCTVRGDLIRILGSLMKRRNKFDRIVVETTGMANPGPVAQTFLVDEDMRENFFLDGIVTLVDSYHFDAQVERSQEVAEQVAFADVIVLNKLDLVDAATADQVERRIRAMNAMARIVRSDRDGRAAVPVSTVLGVGGFDLARALTTNPAFLAPEYPFEWLGGFDLPRGEVALAIEPGPDPTIDVLLVAADRADEGVEAAAERLSSRFEDAQAIAAPGARLKTDRVQRLPAPPVGAVVYRFDIPAAGYWWLATQHRPEEFALTLAAGGMPLQPAQAQAFAAAHTHSDDVASISIDAEVPIDRLRFERWIGTVLSEFGTQIYRFKGLLDIAGSDRRIVIQGVHMLMDSLPLDDWGDRPRRSQLVFIGRDLPAEVLIDGFDACLSRPRARRVAAAAATATPGAQYS